MNKRAIKHLLLLGGLIMMLPVFAGCGKETEGATPASTETAAAQTPGTDDTAAKRAQYEELMRENTSLWNSYNEVLQEIAYYDTFQQQDTAKETTYVSAEEKLNQTREENPIRLRVDVNFSAEPETEEVIPDTQVSSLRTPSVPA